MADFENVGHVDELKPGESKSVIVDDTPVLLIRAEDSFFAIEDVCTHDEQPLNDGVIAGETITCVRHGASFDIKSGSALSMPATQAVTIFQVKLEGGNILVAPSDGSPAPVASLPPAEPKVQATPVSFNASVGQPEAAEEESTPSPADTPVVEVSEEEPEGPMPEDGDLIEALKQVIDPELMINIVDLGLIYNVEKQDGAKVAVDMTLTSPACPAGPQIVQQSKMALERLRGVTEANITLVMTPPWTPERMTDDARDQLGIF